MQKQNERLVAYGNEALRLKNIVDNQNNPKPYDDSMSEKYEQELKFLKDKHLKKVISLETKISEQQEEIMALRNPIMKSSSKKNEK